MTQRFFEVDGEWFGLIHPGAFALYFGFYPQDCFKNLRGMIEQLKAESWGMA